MKNRSELREVAMKVLYQIDILKDAKEEYDIEALVKEQLEVKNNFVNELINGVLDNYKSIKKLANDHLNEWTIDRLSKVKMVEMTICGQLILAKVYYNIVDPDDVSWKFYGKCGFFDKLDKYYKGESV